MGSKFYSLIVFAGLLSVNTNLMASGGFAEKHTKSDKKIEPTFSYVTINNSSLPLRNPSIVTPTQAPFKPIPSIKWNKNEVENTLTVKKEPNNGMPMQIEGLKHNLSLPDLTNETKVLDETQRLLTMLSSTLFVGNGAEAFKPMHIENDHLNITHVKLQQIHHDIEIYGSQGWLHFYPNGEVYFNGRTRPEPSFKDSKSVINETTAQSAALTDFYVNERKLENFQQYTAQAKYTTELVWLPSDERLNDFVLVWHVTVRPDILNRWEYYINATNGDVVSKYNHTCTLGPTTATANDLAGVAKTINVFQDGSTYYMINTVKDMYTGSQTTKPGTGKGIVITLDMQNTNLQNPSYVEVTSNNNTWSPTAVSAHNNASLSYDYFKNTFNRQSIDGKGGDVVSFINVADDNGGGLDNAFWNGQYMFYGNGNQAFTALAKCLDVGGHEMAHGVTQETAGLEYKNESGALNEHYSDVFGVMIDRDDWTLGEGVVKTSYIPSGILRSMADPHNGGNSLSDNGWQPKHTNEQYTGTQDNGGVHINSGIPNHAFYLIANAIGKDKAEQIYYRALTNYLTKTSKFIDMRLAIVKAATDLHGANSTEVNTAKQSFDAVGIFDGNGSGGPSNLPTNPGQGRIIFADMSGTDPVKLYMTDEQASGFQALSQVQQNRKASVTDNGSYAVFVGSDKNIYSVQLTSPFTQTQLTSDGFWDNAAISRDGSRIAAVSTVADTSIWVYDFGKQQWAQFQLYNPTTGSGGATMGGVRYADAIEWDYSGEYILYDAYNVLNNLGGGFIDYWDMGFLRAWNKGSNNWGDGNIFKVFSSLDEGINIGNATFSKNSPYILSFDFENTGTGVLNVLGANLETNTVGLVWDNLTYGTPSYSLNDGKIAFSALDQSNNPVVAVISLNNDKITGNSTSIGGLISAAKWPVWFGTGTRQLPSSVHDLKTDTWVKVYPNPSNSTITVETSNVYTSETEIKITNLLGEVVLNQSAIAGTQKTTVDVSALPVGSYLIKTGSSSQAIRFIKTP